MKLFYQFMAIFLNFSPTSNHLHSLQVENCGSNSRLVVDEDDSVKSGLKGLIKGLFLDMSSLFLFLPSFFLPASISWLFTFFNHDIAHALSFYAPWHMCLLSIWGLWTVRNWIQEKNLEELEKEKIKWENQIASCWHTQGLNKWNLYVCI